MLKKILFGGESGLSFAANAGLTLLRIFTGVALMLAHGSSKVPPPEGLVKGAAGIGFPAPALFAWAAGLSEFAGGAFLALGLLTRLSSFFYRVHDVGRSSRSPLRRSVSETGAGVSLFLYCYGVFAEGRG